MKKVKFMLLAIAVIAIAGGTLAFKAKYDRTICTDEARPDPLIGGQFTCVITEPGQQWTAVCNDEVVVDTEPDENTVTICYTVLEDDDCPTTVTGANCETLSVDFIED